MKVIKMIVAAVWPIIYAQLMKLALSTDTRFDEIALQAVDSSINAWLEMEDKDES